MSLIWLIPLGLVVWLIVDNWKTCQTQYLNVSKTGVPCANNDSSAANGGYIVTKMNPIPRFVCLLNPFPGGL